MKLYHFTCIEHWPTIESAGFLKLTDSNLMRGRETRESITEGYMLDTREVVPLPDGRFGINHISTLDEEKVVHLTRNPNRSSTELLWAGGQHTAYDKTRIRITVEVPDEDVHVWNSWHDRQGGSKLFKESLKATGGDWKSWFVCEREIPRAEWVEVCDLDTGRVLWRRFNDDAPVTKADVQRGLEMLYWADMPGAPLVIMNHRASVGSAFHMAENEVPIRVDHSVFRDQMFLYLEPEPSFSPPGVFAVGCSYRFYEEDGVLLADVKTIVSRSAAPLSEQRWQDMSMVVSEAIKVAKDGELILSTYRRGSYMKGQPQFGEQAHVPQFTMFYLSMVAFLGTTYVVQERRKHGREPVKTPNGTRQQRQESEVSVVIYRRPEKVAAKIQKKIREQMERDGKKWMLDHEVCVSGHYRNQYYPSTGTHARIWISDHKKGPEGVPAQPRVEKQKVIKAVR